jgi:hypothetical protein
MNDTLAPSRGQRLKEELMKYAIISTYLFVCFAVLLMYKASTEAGVANHPVPWTLALVKALVLGKFILIGHALSVGSRGDAFPLLHRIAWKSLAMLLVLLVFTALEELIVGWIHGLSFAEIVDEVAERSWIQVTAPVLLMLLILVPLIAVSELYRSIGAENFRDALTGR